MMHHIDLSRVDLNLLVLFETVMETRHVRRAAERLCLSPSAVSHGLGRLRVLFGDPLFLKMPKGVAPTDSAMKLAAPISEILSRVRDVMENTAPFDPTLSKRRFTIGAPDGISSVLLPPLLAQIQREAPNVDISVRQLLARQAETTPALAWVDAFAELDARTVDLAILPLNEAPARFAMLSLYDEDFVIGLHGAHRGRRSLSLSAYAAMQHLVVSETGEPTGVVDARLAEHGLSRRVAVTVPNFSFALAMLSENDFACALPRRFVSLHGARFGVTSVKTPFPMPRFTLSVATPKVAQHDAGLAWFVQLIQKAAGAPQTSGGRKRVK